MYRPEGGVASIPSRGDAFCSDNPNARLQLSCGRADREAMRPAALSARAYMLLSNGAIICLLAGGLLVLGRTAPDAAGETAGFALLAAGFVGLFLHRLRLARFYTRVIAGLQNAGALLAETAHELREAAKASAATSSEQAAAVAETAATDRK